MTRVSISVGVVLSAAVVASAPADVFHDYGNFEEGLLGETVVHDGVTYRDANRVSGFFPDGDPFDENELGSDFIIERANVRYDEFPDYVRGCCWPSPPGVPGGADARPLPRA